MRRKKLKPTLRSIYHSPKYQPKVVLKRLTLQTLSKYKASKEKKDSKRSHTPTPKVLPLPPRRKISIDLVESRSVQENVVSSGSSVVESSRPKRKASTASHSDDQEVSVVAVNSKSKSVRLKSRALSSGRTTGGTQHIVYQVNVVQVPRRGPSSAIPRGTVSSTSSASKGNYEEDGFLNSADDMSSREGTPDASNSRPWPTPKIVSVSSMAVPDSQAKLRVRKPLLSSQDEAASSSETIELEEPLSIPQPTTTTSSPTKEKATAQPPAKIVRLANDADETVPEAEVPQPAQLDFWEKAKKVAAVQKSLDRLQTAVTEVAKAAEQKVTQIQALERSNGVEQIICDPRCVELQRTLAALGIADEIFVKLAGIISDSQPGTEFYNPKAAVIMNLIKEYTSLY